MKQKSKIKAGWLESASPLSSPNFDERPRDGVISLIVIHCISLPPAEFGNDYISQFFTNCLNPDEHPYFETIKDLHVSSHLLIQRDGTTIQYVPFHKRAWHAGTSCYAGKNQCNDFSVGIELEGTEETCYADEQYVRLADAVLSLVDNYPTLSRERIVGHSDIAPERKTDPGDSFDWERLYSLLR